VSRRRFLGWEPKQVTTYEYDDGGRVVRAVTVVEAEWDDTERAWATALLDAEADECSGCGEPLSETLRPEAYQGYEVGPPAVCQGCKALHARQRSDADAGDKDLHANRYSVVRTWQDPHDPARG
jgi:hypothetical protein